MRTLHITNGHSAGDTLREFIADPIVISADVLHEGPAPAVSPEAWIDTRARFLSAGDAVEFEHIRRGLTETDAAIASAARFDQVILWFEHDLFDQLILIRTLDLLSRVPSARVSLICIGEFPGVERFVGLGQLTAKQLETLVDKQRHVSADDYRVAQEAWNVFRAPDPTGLLLLARRLRDAVTQKAKSIGPDEGELGLPFLGDALYRLLAEYPSTTNGLSTTADALLRTLDVSSPTAAELFMRTQALETRPFMGDWTFYGILDALATCRTPLVTIDRGGVEDVRSLSGARVAATAAGRDVSAGRLDAVTLNGIDQWRGGVHLSGRESSPWRWDSAAETLIS